MSDTQSTLPIIYMTHVGYAGGVRTSSRQFDGPASKRVGKDFLTIRGLTGGSLLAQALNGAWCEALNKQKDGENIKYFAMLHDDVVPPDWWLDTLWEDLEASGADLMAAVVPIKDLFGNTSTAIESADKDRFSTQRRIHLAEVQRLPKVFSAADCNYPDRLLLANTGCWICRFDRPWKDAVDEHGNKVAFFTINDKICRSPTTGKWICPVEPEDWFFSRQLGLLGAKVMCTSRMAIQHYGLMPFPSDSNWSKEEFDVAHGDRVGYQMIGSDKPKANTSYDSTELADVAGWLNDDEGRLLSELAEGKSVLEIGSYCGRSTIWLARTAKSVLAVDTFDGRGTSGARNTLDEFEVNIRRHGVADKIDVMGSTTADMAKNIQGDPDVCQAFDLIFVDGAHDYPSVVRDLEQCLQVLAPGGLIAFHDYERPTDPGVTKAVDEQIKRGAEVVNRAGTIVVLKVQPVPSAPEVFPEVKRVPFGGAGGSVHDCGSVGCKGHGFGLNHDQAEMYRCHPFIRVQNGQSESGLLDGTNGSITTGGSPEANDSADRPGVLSFVCSPFVREAGEVQIPGIQGMEEPRREHEGRYVVG